MIDHLPTTDARRILDQIRARGERITTPRRAVIELLASTHEHLTVEDIASRLHPAHPSIAPSTVYRTLEALQEWGMVERVHRGHGATFFHLAQAHQHLVCEVCGKVLDIPTHALDDLVIRLRDEFDFELRPTRFALLGECREHREVPYSTTGSCQPPDAAMRSSASLGPHECGG